MIETITIDTEQWAVVPRVPTQAMIDAVYGCVRPGTILEIAHTVWQEMLAAAPRPEAGQPACTVCHGQTGYEADELYGDQVTGRRWVDCAHCKGDGAEPQQPTPRPEAVQQSDAFLVWLPRLIAEYEKQARHNKFTPDVSLDFVKRALAEYKHAAKQSTARPVPTSERLPTEADADPWGNVLAFSKIWDVWSFAHWGTIAKYGNTIWLPTGLVRPAEVKP